MQTQASSLQQLVPKGIKCVVSKRISKVGKPILYMTRDNPVEQTDSGWTFLSGEELDFDEQFMENGANFQMYELNTVANVDPSVVPLLNTIPGAAFERDTSASPWRQVTDIPPEGPVEDPYLYHPPANNQAA